MPRRDRRAEPPPPWKIRFDGAVRLIEQHSTDTHLRDRLRETEAALAGAVADRLRLARTIAELDPDRITAELKAALRARTDVTAPDTPLLTSLRQRHELLHGLRDRLEQLDDRIEQTLVDLENLAAGAISLSFDVPSAGSAQTDLQRLNDDIAALAAAHREIADL